MAFERLIVGTQSGMKGKGSLVYIGRKFSNTVICSHVESRKCGESSHLAKEISEHFPDYSKTKR